MKIALFISACSAISLKMKGDCEPGVWCPGNWDPAQPPVWTVDRFDNMNERSWIADEPKAYRVDYGPPLKGNANPIAYAKKWEATVQARAAGK